MKYNIDIAIFSEYKSVDFHELCEQTPEYRCIGLEGSKKILAIHKNNISLKLRREQNRYSLYSFWYNHDIYNIAGVHLPANPRAGMLERTEVIRLLVHDIGTLEKENKSEKTIIVGDFNANPFDPEMVNQSGLNAVLYKDLIIRKETDMFDGHKYKRFYNPMLTILSEEEKIYGSHYCDSGIVTLYWYMYDQVIVRKVLCDSIKSMQFCKNIDGISLVTKLGNPDKNISDHLPLIVEVQL